MKLKFIIFFTLLVPRVCISQVDSSFIAGIKALDTANMLRQDTAAVPEDALTKKIRMLRNEKNGLTIENIIRLKLADEQKDDTTHSKDYYNKLLAELTPGKTSRLIDNCLINLYRRTYTEKELHDLISF